MAFKSVAPIKSDNVIGDVTLFDLVTGSRAGFHVPAGIKFITMGLFGDIKKGASPTATPEYKCTGLLRQCRHRGRWHTLAQPCLGSRAPSVPGGRRGRWESCRPGPPGIPREGGSSLSQTSLCEAPAAAGGRSPSGQLTTLEQGSQGPPGRGASRTQFLP